MPDFREAVCICAAQYDPGAAHSPLCPFFVPAAAPGRAPVAWTRRSTRFDYGGDQVREQERPTTSGAATSAPPARIWVDRPERPTSAQVYVEQGRPTATAVEYVLAQRTLEDVDDGLEHCLDVNRGCAELPAPCTCPCAKCRVGSTDETIANEVQEVVRTFEKHGAGALLVEAKGGTSIAVGVTRLFARWTAREDVVHRMWQTLKGIEWAGTGPLGIAACPACLGYKPSEVPPDHKHFGAHSGHAKGCSLEAALAVWLERP